MNVLYGAKSEVLSRQLFDDKGNTTTIVPKEATLKDLFYPAILEGSRVGQNLPGTIVPKNGVRINGVDMPELVFPYITPSVETKDGGNGLEETSTITFKALKTGQSVTVAGLTLTASTNMSANEVAASFAEHEDFQGYVSGLAVDDHLTLTSTSINTNVDNIAVSVNAVGDIGSDGKVFDPASEIAAWVNAQSKLTHVTAQAFNTIEINPQNTVNG
jgi:hypothetical protein